MYLSPAKSREMTIIFQIKEVAPNTTRDQFRKQFWKHDIKVTRNYNKTIQVGECTDMRQNILEQMAAIKKIKNMNHFSTDLSKGNVKLNIKRPEYTWSPCFGNLVPIADSNPVSETARGEHRRLSQIFSPLLGKVTGEASAERLSEKTPLLKVDVTHKTPANTFLLSSGKKITVTPCDTP